LTDLAQRGLLEDTLVWWGGEFGRTPYAERNGTGRDHNPGGFSVWLAGGGVKPGIAYGETDEFGHHAVVDKVHMHDLHATVLHLLGLDHEKLTFRHDGRDYRLTDVYGHVVKINKVALKVGVEIPTKKQSAALGGERAAARSLLGAWSAPASP
jgi:hypothetical protein